MLLEHPALCLGRHDELLRSAASAPGLISFAGGLPDPQLFPTRELERAFKLALSHDAGAALQYGWPEGSERLRSYVASSLAARGADVREDEVVITSGAQQAIQLALSVAPLAPSVGVESETYPGALDAFRAARARLTRLEQPADLYYTMPSVSNPVGRRMTSHERRALLAQANKSGAWLLEDDAYEGTWFSGKRSRPLLADDRERVFHIGTFSKTLCPGLRVGWLVAPPALARSVLREKQHQDLQTNGLSQALLVHYLSGNDFARHRRRTRARYRKRAAALMHSVKTHLPQLRFHAPGGGFSLWLEGDVELDQERLLASAIELGVSFDPGHLFQPAPTRRLSFRLCYSAVRESDIDSGVQRLAAALARVAPARRQGSVSAL